MVLSGWSQAPENDGDKSVDNTGSTSESLTVETEKNNEIEIVQGKKRKLPDVSEDVTQIDAQEIRATKKLEVLDEDDDVVILDHGDFGSGKKKSQCQQ